MNEGAFGLPRGDGLQALLGLVGFALISDEVLSSAKNFFEAEIPPNYQHLLMFATLRTDDTINIAAHIRFNGDSSAIYDHQIVLFNNGTTSASAAVNQTQVRVAEGAFASSPTNHFGSNVIFVPDYKNMLRSKIAFGLGFTKVLDAATDQYMILHACEWRSSDPIRRVAIWPADNTKNWIAGSRLSIYGIGGAS